MMREDFFEVAGYAAGRGLYVSVAMNGTMLTEKNVERLKQSGVSYVEVSLDGAKSVPTTRSEESGTHSIERSKA